MQGNKGADMHNSNMTKGLRIDLEEDADVALPSRKNKACIKVIGVGGAGGNAVRHMIEKGVKGVEFICANTDAQALECITGARLIQLGKTGLGAGNLPVQGEQAARETLPEIEEAIHGADLLFITAGMGGGTGTGAAPVIAELARQKGILTIAVVTKPFKFEGNRRKNNAEAGLLALAAHTDARIVILNAELAKCLSPDVPHKEAFAYADDVLRYAVGGIAEVINIPGVVNVDLADIKTAVSNSGKALMGTSVATGADRAVQAAKAAISCPLLEGVNLRGATGVIVLVSGLEGELKMKEVEDATDVVLQVADLDAQIVVGTAYDDSLAGSVRVTVIVAGLQEKAHGLPAPAAVTATTAVVDTVTESREISDAKEATAPRDLRAPTVGARPNASLRGAPLFPPPPLAPIPGRRPAGSYEPVVRPGVWRPMHSQGAQDPRPGAVEPAASDDLSTPACLRVPSN
ncbi:cell division protein FtsZ [Candidatus Symbiobacter mobilis CR]|uniref:Cell division protein FtsZ n=2 Tax=Candidatus Symbiobacter TaxID=1436289 RepID=U5N6S5_9BURK|nr:cell division protein FtsZ [Candidatus Symbiobacter mobilis CR]